jgi:hypothetical protein
MKANIRTGSGRRNRKRAGSINSRDVPCHENRDHVSGALRERATQTKHKKTKERVRDTREPAGWVSREEWWQNENQERWNQNCQEWASIGRRQQQNKTRRKLLQRADQGKSIEGQAAHDSTGIRDEATWVLKNQEGENEKSKLKLGTSNRYNASREQQKTRSKRK